MTSIVISRNSTIKVAKLYFSWPVTIRSFSISRDDIVTGRCITNIVNFLVFSKIFSTQSSWQFYPPLFLVFFSLRLLLFLSPRTLSLSFDPRGPSFRDLFAPTLKNHRISTFVKEKKKITRVRAEKRQHWRKKRSKTSAYA